MIELGELDKQHDEFTKREVRIVAVSADDLKHTAQMQERFQHLTILSDDKLELVKALKAVHEGVGPEGNDIAAPTTLLIHRQGRIAWTFRPERQLERLSAKELLAAVDKNLR